MNTTLNRSARLLALLSAVLMTVGVHAALLAGFEHLADQGTQQSALLARCCASTESTRSF
jgi:hypothetical protein